MESDFDVQRAKPIPPPIESITVKVTMTEVEAVAVRKYLRGISLPPREPQTVYDFLRAVHKALDDVLTDEGPL